MLGHVDEIMRTEVTCRRWPAAADAVEPPADDPLAPDALVDPDPGVLPAVEPPLAPLLPALDAAACIVPVTST